MKNFFLATRNILRLAILAAGGLILSGCISEDAPDDSFVADQTPNNVLTIRIPNLETILGNSLSDDLFDDIEDDADTRAATVKPDQSEAKISELLFFAFPTTGGGNPIVFDIKDNKVLDNDNVDSGSDSSDYTGYKEDYVEYTVENVPSDTYKIYLIANVNNYLEDDKKIDIEESTSITEDEIRKTVLQFSSLKDKDTQIDGTKLPLVCLPEDTHDESGNSYANGINISDIRTFYADLNILCAKVRYTILFDNNAENTTDGTGFSNLFYSNAVDFSETAKGLNVRKETVVDKSKTTTATWYDSETNNYAYLPLKRATYPAGGDLTKYLSITDVESDENSTPPSNLNTEGVTFATDQKTRAWQGIVYLPENLDTNKKTKLQFYPEEGSGIGSDKTYYEFNPARGNFYDIVAKLIAPDKVEVTMKVGLNKWTHESYTENW